MIYYFVLKYLLGTEPDQGLENLLSCFMSFWMNLNWVRNHEDVHESCTKNFKKPGWQFSWTKVMEKPRKGSFS